MTDEKNVPATTAMAKRQVGVITTPDEFRSFLQVKRDERCHLLTPVTDIGALPPQWSLVPSAVTLDPDPDRGDVYRDPLFCEGDEVAPSKVGLLKIARAAGISLETDRLDSGTVQYYWSFKAKATYRGLDGQIKILEGTAEYDLRDNAPRVNKLIAAARRKNRDPSAQIEGARMHGLRGCEARACNAAIRQFGLRQKYTRAELAKPFVVFNMVWQPDMSDPTQRAMVAQAALTGTSTLYGGAAALQPAALPANHATGEIIDADTAKAPEELEPEAIPFELPKKETVTAEPPKRLEYFVTSVMRRKAGGFYVETRETGSLHPRTDETRIATTAKQANEAGLMVHLSLETRGYETWITAIAEAGEKL
jgi:hypothetical protein